MQNILRSLTRPSGAAEVYDEYLFGQGKNRESGATVRQKKTKRKKKNTKEKMGTTRPHPDGRVTRKAPGALDPAVALPPFRVQNILRSLKIGAQVV